MTDTSIRVTTENRKRLKAYAGLHDMTHDEALADLLDKADAPTLTNN